MFKLTYKLNVRERVEGKCERHPRYNPEKDGRAGIKGGCSTCYSPLDLHTARLKLDAAVHEFVRGAGPWARAREARRQKRRNVLSSTEESATPQSQTTP